MSKRTKRLYHCTYMWRQRYDSFERETVTMTVSAESIGHAALRTAIIGKTECRDGNSVFLRVHSVKDAGVLR